MTRFAVDVTDHVVVRFIERAMGVDVNAIRTSIAQAVAEAAEAGAANVVIADTGLRFCFARYPENHVRVTTVLPAEWQVSDAARYGANGDKKSIKGPDWRKEFVEEKKQARKRRFKSKKRRGFE